MNTNKTEFICFKQEGAISTSSGMPLKLVDKFTYLGSNTSSTESGVNIHQAKESTFYRLSLIWKSDQSDKIKHDFFQAVAVSILCIDAPHGC